MKGIKSIGMRVFNNEAILGLRLTGKDGEIFEEVWDSWGDGDQWDSIDVPARLELIGMRCKTDSNQK